jgi:predicted esterase
MLSRLFLLTCFVACPTIASGQSTDWLADWLKANPLNQTTFEKLVSTAQGQQQISKQQAETAARLLWDSRREVLKAERAAEMKNREVVLGKLKMPFWYKVFGEKPEGGRSLFISMHGGGGGPARMNDRQYENQKKLYQPKEGVYLVPRAPTNTWNLWHQEHIDAFFDRLITNMIVFEGVNPNKVYFMGYSAGGDGVYQLAPRMADRLAAAAMMAGHPNETKPDGLRNIGFTLFMGGKDAAYKRNKIAAEWKEKLAKLAESDSGGYRHEVTIFEEYGHWMQGRDAVAVPWMAKFTRDPFPKKVVWLQDDVAHSRFYWLQVADENQKNRSRVVASIKGNEIAIEESDLQKLTVLMSDAMLDLDKPVRIVNGDEVLFEGKVERTAIAIAKSLLLRDDPASVVSASVDVELKESK